MEEIMKICSCCKQKFPSTNEYFNKSKNMKDGLCTYCRSCSKEKQKRYNKTYRDKKEHPETFVKPKVKRRSIEKLNEEQIDCSEGFKICSKCHKVLPDNIEFFNKNATSRNGLQSQCRECLKLYKKNYRDTHTRIR